MSVIGSLRLSTKDLDNNMRSDLVSSNDVASAPQFSPSKGKDMIMKVDDETTANQQEQKIQDTSAQQPIAWLMTFPNSGTTYTLYLVATVTGMNTDQLWP